MPEPVRRSGLGSEVADGGLHNNQIQKTGAEARFYAYIPARF
jgi:hypothetical protein